MSQTLIIRFNPKKNTLNILESNKMFTTSNKKCLLNLQSGTNIVYIGSGTQSGNILGYGKLTMNSIRRKLKKLELSRFTVKERNKRINKYHTIFNIGNINNINNINIDFSKKTLQKWVSPVLLKPDDNYYDELNQLFV